MNVLITGGAGFIGTHLTERLLLAGHKVWAVDNFSTGKRHNPHKFAADPNYTFWEGSVVEQDFVDYCLGLEERMDRIYDLACPTGVPNIEKLGEEMLLVCSQGARHVLELARKWDADMLHTSSSEIYGDPLVFPQSETYTGNVDPLGPRANYEEGKRFSETWAKLYADKYGVRVRLVRLFNVYGPYMSISDERVVPRFGQQALLGQSLTVHGDGMQTRTLCFIQDILDGFELVITKGQSGEVYNLGSDQELKMKELAELIIQLAGSESTTLSAPRASHDHNSRMPDLKKLRLLGWSEQTGLQEGLMQTLQGFREQLARRDDGLAS